MRLANPPSRLRRLAALSLVFLSALATSAASTAEEVWITIEQGAWSAFEAAERGLPAAGEPAATAVEADSREIVAVPLSETRIDALTAFMHLRYGVCGGFLAHPSREAALAEVDRMTAEAAAEAPAPPVEYTIDNGPVVRALSAELQESNIRNTITSLAAFFTRRHNCPTGLDSANWIKNLWTGYAASRPDVTVEFFNHPPATTPQPSVILTIPGDPTETGIVVLGAHQDSTAGSNCSTSRSPGADDDATGVAVLSEVIRVALARGYEPQQTVKFMAYAAEEVGLRGSGDIAATYQQQGANVVGVLQLDMTNYHGSVADIYLVTDFTNAAQNTFLAQLADAYVASARVVGTLQGTTACGYGCSDHASWNSRGYPASFPFEATFGGSNPFIHTVNDTLANMGNNANQSVQFARLAVAYMAELAKGSLTAPPLESGGLEGTRALGSQPTLRR